MKCQFLESKGCFTWKTVSDDVVKKDCLFYIRGAYQKDNAPDANSRLSNTLIKNQRTKNLVTNLIWITN